MKKLFLLSCALLFVSFSFDYSSAQSVAQSACKYETQNNNDNKEYLKFLYDYMPLSDRADYDTSFFEAQVKTAIQAR